MVHRSLPLLTRTSRCFSSHRTYAGDFESPFVTGVLSKRTKEVRFFDPVFCLQVGIGRLPADNDPKRHPSLPLHTAT